MANRKINTPRGFHDRSGSEAERMGKIADIVFKEAGLYGARQLQVSPVGYKETFLDDTNLGEEKTYSFEDRSGRSLVLNCDSLPAVMRTYVGSGQIGNERYTFSIPVHRYRRTKLRYYHHLGANFINEPVNNRNELAIPEILIKSLRKITSKRVNIVMNEFRLWIGIFQHFGFTEEEARLYLYYYRFSHQKGTPVKDPKLERVISKVQSNVALRRALDKLHAIDPGDFTNTSEHVFDAVPDQLEEKLKPYYENISGLVDSVNELRFDPNEFHSSEFFSGLGYRIYLDGDDCHIGDGGSYHTYGQSFSSKVKTVYSGVVRHEDLLMSDDKIEKSAETIGVYLLQRGPEVDELIVQMRDAGIALFEDEVSKKASQSANHFTRKGIKKFAVIGSNELSKRAIRVKDLETGEIEIIQI